MADAARRWRFRAVDVDGDVVTGEASGADMAEIVARLRAEGRLPIEIRPAAGGLWALLNTELTPRDALPAAERVGFTRGLSALIDAGLPIDRALEMLSDLGESRAQRRLAQGLCADVRGGASLSDALDRRTAAFPAMFRGLVRAGETSGALGPALARLAAGEEAAARRAAALRAALIYPAFLLVAAAAAIAVLLTVVVPTFAPMLEGAGVTPPLATRIVFGAGDAAARRWPAALAVLSVGAVAAQLALRRPGARAALCRALFRTPMIGPIRRKLASARAARTMGEALRGGVALPAALRLARDAAGDAAMAAELDRVTPQAEAGAGLATPLADGAVMSPLAIQMIGVGQETGTLPAMALKAADILDTQAQTALDRLMATLSPALTLVMGGLIALIVSSFLFALSSINEIALSPS